MQVHSICNAMWNAKKERNKEIYFKRKFNAYRLMINSKE